MTKALWLCVTGRVAVSKISNEVPRGEEEEENDQQKAASDYGRGER